MRRVWRGDRRVAIQLALAFGGFVLKMSNSVRFVFSETAFLSLGVLYSLHSGSTHYVL